MVALADVLLLLMLLFTYFGLRFAGDPTPFLVATVLYAFCVAAFGTLIGAAIPNQAAAMQAVAMGGFLLVFMLSGLIFPFRIFRFRFAGFRIWIWGRYYIDIVRDFLLQGGGWPAVWWKVILIGDHGVGFLYAGAGARCAACSWRHRHDAIFSNFCE